MIAEGLGAFHVEVLNSVADYVAMVEEIFDLSAIKRLIAGELTGAPFKMQLDAMCGATGPYLATLFGERLGASQDALLNTITKPDFGGGHPDPNLTYAHHLVDSMKKGEYDFGAAFDGDGVRYVTLFPFSISSNFRHL